MNENEKLIQIINSYEWYDIDKILLAYFEAYLETGSMEFFEKADTILRFRMENM